MKRLRDDHVNSQFKRPLHGQRQIPGGGGDGRNGGGAGSGVAAQKLTPGDALTYLKEVKEMFEDQKEKYDMFLDVMKDFKAQRIDTVGVIERVKELFKGHNNLIYGFNTFLPKGYEITVIEAEEAQPRKSIEFEEAINFVNKIKTRFHNDDYVYKSFLYILNMYRKEHKGINEVYLEVAALFHDHQDLLDEFIRFLPNVSAVASEHHATLGRKPLHLYEERSSPAQTLYGAHMDKQRFRRDRILAPHTVRDLSVECPVLDDDKTTINKESRDRRIRDKDYGDPDHDIHSLSEKHKFARKVENFGGDPILAPCDDKEALKNMYKQEFTFCEKVKERLQNTDDYQAFLKCLKIYSTEIITRKELQGLVTDLIGKYPDLMEGFNKFLERCEKNDGFLADLMSKKYFRDETVTSKIVKEGDKDNEQRCDIDAAKENDRFKEKYWGKSIQELDLSDCEHCTPSYRLLPKDYPIPMANQRSELEAQVLNDYWVSVTSGSEDYSFKHMRRNQYEESLFRCEDDRFELDMLLESVSSTIKCAEELLKSINEKTINLESPIRIENHFSALNLRCIERLYGDHGLDAMETLRKNPSHSLPVILTRLKQKQEEWSMCHSDFNKVWAEIYAKNHFKSLDHRSFYFKQQDSKNLSIKSLLAEIKELKEKRQQEDNVLLAIATGSRHPISPNLKFEYIDTNIHEDFYKLIKYSCDEICTSKEQSKKAMRLWRTFLEPMLSVPSRPLDFEESEVASVSRHRAIKSAMHSIRGRDGGLRTDAEILSSKLSKSLTDREETVYPDKKDTVRKSLFTGNLLNKENDLQKDLKHATIFYKGSSSNGTVAFAECSTSSDAHLAIGRDNNVPYRRDSTQRPPSSAAEKDHGVPCNVGGAASLEHPAELRSVQLENGGLEENTCLNNCKEDSVEKEEGELSPNGDFEEDNFVAYGGSLPLPNTKETANTTHYHADIGENTSCQDARGENDADDDDSENAFEAGEDVSGSESVADECSHEGQEEEEDAAHDEVEGRAESECETEELDGALNVGDASLLSQSEHFMLTTKPLAKHVHSALHNNEKDSQVFYGNDAFYVLFRLHQILYERLLYAKQHSSSAELKLRNVKDTSSLHLYDKFMKALYNLLDGSSDNAKFEDDCRDIIGNQAYVLFTLDKLIYKLVKQLQTVASDEMDIKLLQLYEYEKSRKPGNFFDSVYYENAHVLLHDENIYRFESLSGPPLLLIQLMDDGDEKTEVVAASMDPHFAAYLHSDFLAVPSKKESPGIMLLRNRQNCENHNECAATCMDMECVRVVNGLECKMACNSSKLPWVYGVVDVDNLVSSLPPTSSLPHYYGTVVLHPPDTFTSGGQNSRALYCEISYVLDTEDFFCRMRSKRRNSPTLLHLDEAKVQQFHQLLSAANIFTMLEEGNNYKNIDCIL